MLWTITPMLLGFSLTYKKHLTLSINILLDKLNYYGIRGTANDWFRSYLTKKTRYVTINGFNTDEVTMHIGVPQRSVLGPLLF